MKTISSTHKEILRFLFVGTITVCVDFLCYRFSHSLRIDLAYAKAIGFISGTLFAYFVNRFWTFSAKDAPLASVWRFVVVYSLNLCVNVLLNMGVLALLAGTNYAVVIAFLIATGTSAVLNFVGMKFYVFNTSCMNEWGRL
ncbi:GtrA family protein [Pectobacteriaceae bacterium CE70]|nr:GtrA family protein [Prodigiosinella sp. LS101]WJV58961.1 GtrA family protein [Pectobacteriaceae bacterium C111]WJV63243.1 GtrA family protein [Pectobacteriaceae bacterium C52]WJV67612.1 GtrA family protein [Pectobacteriaceae bacterium CE70]WJY11554.1 GtrA family protein [Pectobacteriaceae bacterium C80]WJV54599.1 GtrA family protein [Prodigiosinella sp. LS101]